MGYENIGTVANEILLDTTNNSLKKQGVVLSVRDRGDDVMVRAEKSEELYGSEGGLHGFMTEGSLSETLRLFEHLGYHLAGGSYFTTDSEELFGQSEDEPIELEAKVSVSKWRMRRLKRNRLGHGTWRGSIDEENYLLDNRRLKLRRKGKLLRIRTETSKKLGKEIKKHTLTYKGPRGNKDLNSRLELNLPLNTYSGAAYMLKMMGYRIIGGYHKRREVHEIGNTMVFFDQVCKWDPKRAMPPVEYWKCFVEVEGPSEKTIKSTLWWKLGLLFKENIKQSYLEIL